MLIGLASVLLVINLSRITNGFPNSSDNLRVYELVSEFKRDDIIPEIESPFGPRAISRKEFAAYASMIVEGIPKHCGHVDEWLTTPETMDVASLKDLKRRYGSGFVARVDQYIDVFAPEIMARHLRPNDLKRAAHDFPEPNEVDRAVDKELARRSGQAKGQGHRTRNRAR